MDFQALNTELTTDPLGRGYSGMTDEQADADLNTAYRSRNKTSMSGAEIWENTDATDFAGLTDAKKSEWISFCGIEKVDPFGPAANFVTYIFGGGSSTVTALAAARVESISRSTELFGESMKVGYVQHARAL